MIIDLSFRLFGYSGLTLFPFIFVYKFSPRYFLMVEHEKIHLRQQLETLFIGFVLVYFIAYLIGRLKGLSHDGAYRAIPFEREAYEYESKPAERKWYGWAKGG